MIKKKWIYVTTIVLVVGVAFFFFSKSKKQRSGQFKFKTIQVKRGDLDVKILSTGTVGPENRLNIQSPVAGRAEQVLVDQGYNVKKGQILAWVSSTERASLLDTARAEGEVELKKWEELYKPTPVVAPVSGMIIQRNIQPGQTFSTTDPIMVMSDHLIVQAQVDETDISQIHLKQPAEIVLDAYPNDMVQGEVVKIAYDAKTVNNVTTYAVDVRPVKVPAYMRSGMTANISVPAGHKSSVLIIPSDAVKSKDGLPFVLTPDASNDNEPKSKKVTLGTTDGKNVEILTGLEEGESLLEPEFKLSDPSKLQTANPFQPSAPGMGGRH